MLFKQLSFFDFFLRSFFPLKPFDEIKLKNAAVLLNITWSVQFHTVLLNLLARYLED